MQTLHKVLNIRGWSRPNLTVVTAFGYEKTGTPKKHFPVKNKPVSVTKRPLFTSKLAFYSFLEVFHTTKWSKMFVRLI